MDIGLDADGGLDAVDDRLSALGVGVGVYLVLAGLATLLGMPWQYGGSAVETVGQVVGVLATVGIGAGLAWLVTRS